jgi:PPK2 family polyphosphate:nucleotide phosphotransferase
MHADWTISSPQKVSLADFDPDYTGDLSQKRAHSELTTLLPRLAELQELLNGAARQSVLIVLQGIDTAGKDGTIKHVTTSLNPLGCRVASFKEPTEEELSHDFLWRVHRQAPPYGIITIFNRSHYEDVLVARVHQLVPPSLWKQRYEEINDFERLLVRNGTLVLKFFLHISKNEQRERLLAREEDSTKSWKLSVADWQDHARFDAYQSAYEDALGRCGTRWAPWYIVPANHKWFRNYVVANRLVEQLADHEHLWRTELEARGRAELARLASFRAIGEIDDESV